MQIYPSNKSGMLVPSFASPWCLTGIADEGGSSLEQQLRVHSLIGWSTLELRSISRKPIGAFSMRELEASARAIAEAKMAVPVLCSRIGNWARYVEDDFEHDLAELEVLLAWADLLGAKMIRIMSYPRKSSGDAEWRDEVIKRVAALCGRAGRRGVALGVENCSGWAGRSPDRMLELLRIVDSPYIGVLFDTGNPVAHGYDGLLYLKEVLGHVIHVHAKDGIAPVDGREVFTFPGKGEANLKGCLELLHASGYSGLISIEPHLLHIPHLARSIEDGLEESYVSYARALERLVHESLPAGRDGGHHGLD